MQYSSKVGNTGRAWVGLGLPATGNPFQHCTIHIIWWSPRLHRSIAHYRLKFLKSEGKYILSIHLEIFHKVHCWLTNSSIKTSFKVDLIPAMQLLCSKKSFAILKVSFILNMICTTFHVVSCFISLLCF